MTIKNSLEQSCDRFLKNYRYHNPTLQQITYVCLGIQSAQEIEEAIQKKTTADLEVSAECFGLFLGYKTGEKIARCESCADLNYRLERKKLSKKI